MSFLQAARQPIRQPGGQAAANAIRAVATPATPIPVAATTIATKKAGALNPRPQKADDAAWEDNPPLKPDTTAGGSSLQVGMIIFLVTAEVISTRRR